MPNLDVLVNILCLYLGFSHFLVNPGHYSIRLMNELDAYRWLTMKCL